MVDVGEDANGVVWEDVCQMCAGVRTTGRSIYFLNDFRFLRIVLGFILRATWAGHSDPCGRVWGIYFLNDFRFLRIKFDLFLRVEIGQIR